MSFGKDTNTKAGNSTGQDTTSGTTSFDQSPTNPDWVTNLVSGQAGSVDALSATNPQSYIAGPTPLLTTAANAAGDLTSSPWNYDAAADLTRGVANDKAPSIAANMSQFQDPYLKSVVGATSAALDHSDGLARAQDDLSLAGSGAFGGSGAALTKAATEGELSRARAQSIGGLESAGYSTALGGATAQAQLQQQQQQQKLASAAQLANLSSQSAADNRANIATQDTAAQPIQSINQATAQAPIDFQTAINQLLAALPLSLFQGQSGTEDQNNVENQTGTTSGGGSTTTFGFGK